MSRRKKSDVLWLALRYAIQDRESIIDAHSSIPDAQEVKNAQRDIKAFRQLMIDLFGTDKSAGDLMIEKMKPVTMAELRKMVEKGELMCVTD